jgi:hypothetical protein
MATRADFTDEEWEALQKGVTGAGMLVAISDRGFFDTFKEANALAKHLGEAHAKSENELVREVAETHGSPFGVSASPAEVEKGTLDSLRTAITALRAKAPDDLPAYKQLVLDVAESVAEAAKGVSPAETDALETIRSALTPS